MSNDTSGGQTFRTVVAGWQVQEAEPSHRDAIERIWADQFDDPDAPYHQKDLDACFDPQHDGYDYTQAFVALNQRQQVVGFGIVVLLNTGAMAARTTLDVSEFSGRDAELVLSAVTDRWKRKGIGTMLFAKRLEWCIDMDANAVYGVAWQNPEGPTSDPLFQKFGFEQVGPTPDDYYAGRDCLVCADGCDCTGVIYRREL